MIVVEKLEQFLALACEALIQDKMGANCRWRKNSSAQIVNIGRLSSDSGFSHMEEGRDGTDGFGIVTDYRRYFIDDEPCCTERWGYD